MTQTKRTNLPAALALLGVALAFLLGLALGRKPADLVHGDDMTSMSEAGDGQNEVTWTCSMHPQVRQPAFGQCPICGMDLISASSEDAGDDRDLPILRVSERSAALMNIQTWPVERSPVEREVRLLGKIDFDETRMRTITAWVPGRIDRLFVDVEGARVERGDPIAEVYSPALISAQEELLQALRTEQNSGQAGGAMVRAARQRLNLMGLDIDQILEIEQRGAVQDHIVIRSPLSGLIVERVAVEGTFVEAGGRIAVLADLDRVCIDLEAYERDLQWLSTGQTVRFTTEGVPGETFEGAIAQINPFVDERRRTSHVRLFVENPDRRLIPGMFARATVSSRLGGSDGLEEWRDEPPLVIPATAALVTGRRAVVYVQLPDADRPSFELRQVTLGPRAGDRYVVRDGLCEGELVVTHGNFKIDAELQLRGRPSMMSPPDEGKPSPPTIRHDHPALLVSPGDVSPELAEKAAKLVGAYFRLTGSLAADDFEGVRRTLGDLHERATELDQLELSDTAARAWASLSERIHKSIHEMVDAEEIEEVRRHLGALTEQVELLAKSFAADEVGTVYRVHCPMAFNDLGGIWLQADRDVRNPYFGAAMFRCGEVLGSLEGENRSR